MSGPAVNLSDRSCAKINQQQRMLIQYRKILLSLFAIIFGLLTGCGIAEISLRVATPAWLDKEMNDLSLARNVETFGSTVGWSVERIDGKFVRFKPLTSFRVRYYEYDHEAHIDAKGNRAIAVNKNKPSTVVPFLGDSFLFGIGVPDEQTYVSLLNHDPNYEYMNLGVPGSALPNHLDQIEFRHKELGSPPVYVFCLYTGNDFMDIYNYYAKSSLPPPGKQQMRAQLPEWLDQHVYHNRILGRSYVLEFVKRTILRHYFFSLPTHTAILPLPCIKQTPRGRPITSSVLLLMAASAHCRKTMQEFTALAVDHLHMLSTQLKFQALFIIIPDQMQISRELLKTKSMQAGFGLSSMDIQRPNQMIEEELKKYSIPYIDLTDCLQDRADAFYKIDGHFTPEGHRLAAQCLSRVLPQMIAHQLSLSK
jgi:lysophospholipase L1-like esterase